MHVVIGAGPAGLATGWELRRRGQEVLVLEASDRIGGMAAGVEVAGVRVDLGSHRLHPSMPGWLRAQLEALVDLQERPLRARLLVDGRWVPFLPTTLGSARALPLPLAARVAVDAVTSPLRRPRADRYADVVRARFGGGLWRAVHEPMAWKLWGTDPRSLSGEVARRRFTTRPGDVARTLVRARGFLYPLGGFGSIVEALAAGVPVETGRRVTRLLEQDDRVVVGLSDGRIVSASHVHATLPAGQVASMLGLHDEPLAQRRRGIVLVYLVLDRRPYTSFQTHHLPGRHLLATRVSEPTAYRDDPDDPADRTVLCAEIPCWPGDDVWQASGAALGRRVADDLVRCGLPDPRPVAVHVERLPSAYPVVTPAALGVQARAERALSRSARVTVLGRQGLPTPAGTGHVLQMGFEAARCVRADGTFDHSAWAVAREGFRSLVAPD